MLAALDHPPDALCAIFGFLLFEFIMAQAILVLFTAFNAFLMVVKERRLSLGKLDWRLLVGTLGFPFVIGSATAGYGLLGPSGAW